MDTKTFDKKNKITIYSPSISDSREGRFLHLQKFKNGKFVNDRYRIIKKIGQGGFGIVFIAFDEVLKTEVVLKFLDPKTTQSVKKFKRVQREINISRRITDEKIVKVFSLEKWNGIHFLVMEMVSGKSLKDYLTEKGLINWKEFKEIFIQILEGVKVLHDNDIIHRDLKPSNIIITDNNKIKILDFGISRDITDVDKTKSTSELVGSPQYMSPEQIHGKDIDFRSDIYQLGLILYTSLSGSHPFKNSSTIEILMKQINEKYPKISSTGIKIPKFIEYIIEKSLEKKKKLRFRNIDELLTILKSEKVTLIKRLMRIINSSLVRNIIIFFGMLSLVTFLYFITFGSKSLGSIENKGSILIVRNKLGIKIWEKDFSPLKIFKSNIIIDDNLKRQGKGYIFLGEKAITVFLHNPRKQPFSVTASIDSPEFDNQVYFFNPGGEKFSQTNFRKFFNIEPYDFSKSYIIKRYDRRDIDGDKIKESIIRVRHSSMFPSSFTIQKGFNTYSFSNPGNIYEYYVLHGDQHSSSFLLYGINNILSHLKFIAVINFNYSLETDSTVQAIPNLLPNFNTNFTGFLYFLPYNSFIERNNWIQKGEINLIDKNSTDLLTLKIDYTLIVKSENGSKVFKDNERDLQKAYYHINLYYREKILRKDYHKANMYIEKALNSNVQNPYLISALLYLKGDIEVKNGKLEKGRKTLCTALKYYPYNSDVGQKLCEIEFLKGKSLGASRMAENNSEMMHNFWGLEVGKYMFVSYCFLQAGIFNQVEEILMKNSIWEHQDQLKNNLIGFNYLFIGIYDKAEILFKHIGTKRLSPFTLAEYRIFYARTLLLKNIFSDKENHEEMGRAKFYFNDLSLYSIRLGHLAEISKGYFLAREGKKEEVLDLLKSSYSQILKIAKGDMITRLWLFYDSYIYGEAMEILGNKKETIRGYKKCIEANPHTDLARRAQEKVKKLQ